MEQEINSVIVATTTDFIVNKMTNSQNNESSKETKEKIIRNTADLNVTTKEST